MINMILGLLMLVVQNCFTMEQPQPDARIAQLVSEIDIRKKSEHERVARLIYHEPLPIEVTGEQFDEVKIVCQPEYAPVLAQMLNGGVLNPNMYYEFSEYFPVKNRVSLLCEALNCAMNSKKKPKEERYESVILLLKAGVDLTKKAISSTEVKRYYQYMPRDLLPLEYARKDPKLIFLLLATKVKVEPSSLILMAQQYKDILSNLEKKLYTSIQLVLQSGIDVTEKCEWNHYCISPLEYVRANKIEKLIPLFEAYSKK